MAAKKAMAKASFPLVLLLGFLTVVTVAYNLATIAFHRQSSEVIIGKAAGVEWPHRPFHIAVTASGDLYSRWQCRIMYYWFRKIKEAAGEGTEMGGFTRVLHSGEPDNLMSEIPTFVVNPLPRNMDRGYIVLHRPWAFVQWLDKAKIEEDYILMAEPDHIFVKPLPNFARGNSPAAYPFFYIKPREHEDILRKYYPEKNGHMTDIDPIGNSPVIIQKSLLKKIAPTWMNVSLMMKYDPETDKALGWVLEMYGYAVASALHGVRHILHKDYMIQPPLDIEVEKAHIIHYTYICDFTLKGELVTSGKSREWSFNKRSYLHRPPPRNISLPPSGVPDSVVLLVKMVNEATANLPHWEDTR